MSNTTIVNYTDLQSKISELKTRLQEKLDEIQLCYLKVRPQISTLDSAANASALAAIEKNRQKAYVTAEVISNLLDFFEDAAAYVHEQDLRARYNYNGIGQGIRID